MPRPQLQGETKGSTPGQRVLNKFLTLYSEVGNYSPTVIDRANAKRFAENYGEGVSFLLIEKFFDLVKYDPVWKYKHLTVSSAYFHRNELLRKVKEEVQKEIVRTDDSEF